jgi:glycosyltransferase involved in cell wall biosynthesis
VKIALIGTRGVPANYGGFETCAEEIAVGLVERGHEVTAYCRPGNAPGDPAEYKGVRLVYRGLRETKNLGTLTHTANSLVHAVRQDYDILMVFNAGNAPLCIIPRLLRKRMAINVDGLEWKRAKWPRPAKLYYQFGEWAATKLADRIVSDSRGIQDYYRDRFATPSTFIAYGAHLAGSHDPSILEQYGLEPGGYVFVASRLEPENNADTTIAAFERVRTDKKLVIAGGANWDSPYVERLKRTADPRVQLLGPVYEAGHIQELHAQCYAYVHGSSTARIPRTWRSTCSRSSTTRRSRRAIATGHRAAFSRPTSGRRSPKTTSACSPAFSTASIAVGRPRSERARTRSPRRARICLDAWSQGEPDSSAATSRRRCSIAATRSWSSTT